ncbi:hypothetical protein [Cellulomonas sp. Marseille-Q8402]
MTSPAATVPSGTGTTVRDVVHHLRFDPAPLWEPGSRARFTAWVGGSMVFWTALGIGVTALLGAVLDLVA